MRIFHREHYNGEVPFGLIIDCLFNFNFYTKTNPNLKEKSVKRFLIYIFHFLYLLDLSKKPSPKYSNEDLLIILENLLPQKASKTDLYQLTGLSKNSFNKYLETHLKENNLEGRKKFTLRETFNILEYWQGEGQWGEMKAKKKKEVAKILNKGNYKNLSLESQLLFETNPKFKDKLAPREIKELCREFHSDDINDSKLDYILNFNGFEKNTMWIIAIISLILWVKKD